MNDDSATDAAGDALASWAHRETIMRSLAAAPAPIHAQYAGSGLIALRGLGELVYPLGQLAGP